MKKTFLILSAAIFAIIVFSQISSCEKYTLPELSLDKDTVRVSSIEQSFNVVVTSNVLWKTEIKSDWVKADPIAGENTNTVKITLSANTNTEERNYLVAFSSETIKKTLLIIQKGAKNPEPTE